MGYPHNEDVLDDEFIFQFSPNSTDGNGRDEAFVDLGETSLARQLGLEPEQTNGYWCSRCKGIVIGQPDFYHEGRNAKGDISAFSLNVPTGVAACGTGMATADPWNHRILIWHNTPTKNNQPADIILGQADFFSGESNRGRDLPTSNSLFWCYGVYWDGENLRVAERS